MKKPKFSETQIVGFLKMADAGMPVREVCRKAGKRMYADLAMENHAMKGLIARKL